MKRLELMKSLLCVLFTVMSVSLGHAQKNDIVLNLERTSFSLITNEDEQQNTSTLLDINEHLDEREVIKVLKDDSGLFWIIQRQVVLVFDGKTILESFYFDRKKGEVIDAFFNKKQLVLIGEKSSLGILNLNSNIDRKLVYFNFLKGHILMSIVGNKLYSISSVASDQYDIYKADLSISSNLNWNKIRSIESKNMITEFYFDETSQDLIYINDQDDLIHSRDTTIVKLNPSKLDDVYVPSPKIIKHKNGFFIFFNNVFGLYWYENQGRTEDQYLFEALSIKGTYKYHSYDQNLTLLIGMKTTPKLVNTILQISDNNILYKNHDLDFNVTYHVLGEDFESEHILSGGNGIYRVSNKEEAVPGVNKYLHDPLVQSIEEGEVITDVTQHQGKIYAVSERKGSLTIGSVFILKDKKFETIYKDADLYFHKLSSDTINNILWVTAFNEKRHASLFAIENSRIKKVFEKEFIIRKVIATGRNELLLFGFKQEDGRLYGVIYSYQINKNKLEQIFLKENFDIWCAVKINNRIICGTNHTLFEFDRYNYTISEFKELKGQQISAIRKYDDINYVCTKSNGIYLYNEEFEFLKHIDFSRAAISNKVTDIIQDEKQNYWLSTFKGIALLNNDFKFLMRLTPREGLSTYEFNSFASTVVGDNIYFGSMNGITNINTSEFYEKGDNAAKLYNVKANYKNKIHSALADEKSFTFKFIPDNIVFESYFENVASSLPNYSFIEVYSNDEPVHVDQTKHLIKISNLSEGVYEVFQRNLYDEKIKLAEINISPNYSDLIRNVLLAACVGLLGFLFARFINHRERKLLVEKNELENRLVEIKLESLRSQLNPHFVFNCLNSIQYYIQMNEKVLARDYLSKFSKLMRYFLESSRNDKISISEEINLLTLYLDLEKLRFENKFDYNISNSINGDYKIPTMILQPHVENSIVHGISHLEERKGKIDISFISVNNGVTCSISDNGIGRKAATLIKANKQSKHKSRATEIIRERMEILNNQGKGNTQIHYQNKKDKDGKIVGTIVNVTFVTY